MNINTFVKILNFTISILVQILFTFFLYKIVCFFIPSSDFMFFIANFAIILLNIRWLLLGIELILLERY